ncbi:MAG: hypothetical protein KAI71_03200 [Candidatus Pacebacteria bacterium]|nr:hypothetical protein [Candidatus Paceibacterota bacterium]
MSTKTVIVALVIRLVIGFALGSYQNIDSIREERKSIERINAIYSIEYIPNLESETIGINIFSTENPTIGLLG